jgi:hypothetical protein
VTAAAVTRSGAADVTFGMAFHDNFLAPRDSSVLARDAEHPSDEARGFVAYR